MPGARRTIDRRQQVSQGVDETETERGCALCKVGLKKPKRAMLDKRHDREARPLARIWCTADTRQIAYIWTRTA